MAESVYKVIEIVGSSGESWEKVASAAIERASNSLHDLRIAEVVEQLDPRYIGFGPDTGQIAQAGADTFVAGSAVFGSSDYAATIAAMRSEILAVHP